MSLRSRLQPWLVSVWQQRGPTARALLPLAWLHGAWRSITGWLQRSMSPSALPVPVVVIGNIYVGGTGKTPLTAEIVRQLQARGWHPGIVSRGYGRQAAAPRMVDPNGTAEEYGDEPLLLAHATGAPVAVGRDRVGAARLLLSLHHHTDVLIADDGLQHHRLPRTVEIAVVHYRGFGNGWLLPAGPLRDPPSRLASVDAVVFHDQLDTPRPPVRVYSPFFGMRTEPGRVYALKDPQRVVTLAELAHTQHKDGVRVLAACGIGMPDRFFGMLDAAGLKFDTLVLADHYPFKDNPFSSLSFDCALITEKDAVKCRANPALAADGRICVVPLSATLDAGLIDLIEARLRGAPHTDVSFALAGTTHGSSPA